MSRNKSSCGKHFINKLIFSDGSEVSPRRINVIIGPNNTGKSRLLKEIRSEILGHPSNYGSPDYPKYLLSDIITTFPKTVDEIEEEYGPLKHIVAKTPGGWRVREYCNTGIQINPDGSFSRYPQATIYTSDILDLRETLASSNHDPIQFKQFFGPLFVGYSGTEDRLLLASGEPARGVASSDYNTLSSALDVDPLLSSISNTTKALFNKDVILDVVTDRQKVSPIVCPDFSEYRNSVSGSHAPDSSKLANATKLSEEGDGFKSFVSVLLSIIGNKKPVYLLDEPEAFLHPPFAMEMGHEIASLISMVNARDCQLFIASHSSYLIRGILAEMRRLNQLDELRIIRLTRDKNLTQAHVIGNDAIQRIVSTTGFTPAYIDALFSTIPVLTEGPRDAELYTQITSKLLPQQDALFVSVNGKQNFQNKLSFYRDSGSRPCIIADFDILKSVDQFKKVMESANVSEYQIACHVPTANKLFSYVSKKADQLYPSDEAGKRSKEAKEYLSGQYRFVDYQSINEYEHGLSEKINDLINELIQYGILIIRTGIMETIFPEMESKGNKEHSDTWYYDAIDFVSSSENETLSSSSFVKDLISLIESR